MGKNVTQKTEAEKPSQNAMDKILQGEVKQVPRWHFILKNSLLWGIGVICIGAGAITVSLIIFTVANGAWVTQGPRLGIFRHLLIMMPFLWIVLTILFVILFDLFIRQTKRGYKYSLGLILGVHVVLSIVLGSLLYFFGISHIVDDMFSRFRNYNNIERRQAELFNAPEEGMIIGRVARCDNDNIVLIAPGRRAWYVSVKNVPAMQMNKIKEGHVFMIKGKQVTDKVFAACELQKQAIRGLHGQVQGNYIKRLELEKKRLCQQMISNSPALRHIGAVCQ